MIGDLLEKRDVALLQILIRDSRGTDDQIAEATGMSIKEVMDRTRVLAENGVISGLTTKPSLDALKARSVLIFGRSHMRSMDHAVHSLAENDKVAWIAQSTGGRFYVALHLRESDDLDRSVKELERQALMLRPTAAVRSLFRSQEERPQLTAEDMLIARAMTSDPRMSAEEIAPVAGMKVEKVGESLDRMLQQGSLDFSVRFDPNQIANPLCLFHIESLDPYSVQDAAERLMEQHTPSLLFFNTYVNIPQLITCMALTQDMQELRAIMRSMQNERAFTLIEPNPIIFSANLDTWRDSLLRKGTLPKRSDG